MSLSRVVFVLAACALLAPAGLGAQLPQRRWERPGFDFSPDGVWRRRAERVRLERLRALEGGDLQRVNAPVQARSPQPTALAITGTLRVPVFLVNYANVAPPQPAARYDTVLFGLTPPAGRPFTIRTFYEQMSNGLFSMQGQVLGWAQLANNDTFYEGGSGCNGLCSNANVDNLIAEAVAAHDAAVDYGQFDNDGPDGVPNSGDDDGFVDMAIFVHPELGGECGNNQNIWAHRFFYSGWTGSALNTADPRAGGGVIRVNSYTIQSGLGGSSSCNASDIMPVGTVAHETGHGLGLPDLYDTDPFDADDSEGIGEWGLMGSGNYSSSFSPSHMEGFSRMVLGWVTVRDLNASGTYRFGPYTVGDTIFRVLPAVANSRSEYFLLENRQAALGDTALVGRKGPGLLIWHVDEAQYSFGRSSNRVNSGPIHGLWLRQADGLDQLRSSTQGVRNRGDAGDPWPGTSNNRSFGFTGNPAANLNTGLFSGIVIDSIRQEVTGGEMAFRLRFGGLTTVAASDTNAVVRVRGIAYNVYRELHNDGDTLTVEVDSVQQAADGRTRWTFLSWSDGQPRSHQVTATLAGSVITAAVRREFRIQASVTGSGTVTSTPSLDLAAGAFHPDGDTLRIEATPQAGHVFLRWQGDTSTTSPVLRFPVRRPMTLTALFQQQLAIVDSSLRSGVMGAPYLDTIRVSGGTGSYLFQVVLGTGTLPPGITINSSTGVISGIPTNDSTYVVQVQVVSGTQQLQFPVRITVTAPQLTLQPVIEALLGRSSALTADEIRYLDLLGNRNNALDLGDFVAFLDETGLVVDAATMARIMGRSR